MDASPQKSNQHSITLQKSILFFFLLFLLPHRVSSQPRDLQTLLEIKLHLLDNGGLLHTWTLTKNKSCPTQWVGVKFSHGRVRALRLPWKNFTGEISEKIGLLKSLRKLSLHDNQIRGPLPLSLGSLPFLKGLHLFNNMLSGNLPPFLASPSLKVLHLSHNFITGDIPQTWGSNLTILNLSENNLSGVIPPSLENITTLISFNVCRNNLSGSVPFLLSHKFGASAFAGNLRLCGYNLNTTCVENVSNLRNRMGIFIIGGVFVLLLVVFICVVMVAVKKKGKEVFVKGGEVGGKLVHFDERVVFTADDLLCATAEIMGKSVYGTVYKATLEDGRRVAVKRLREKMTKSSKEFEAEVNVLGRIRHCNLVELLAYYMGPKGEKLLAFDYMPGGSLASLLQGKKEKKVVVGWETRRKIIKGVAAGLSRLHTNEKITHGNLTSTNILLDEDKNAKLGDYGMGRLMATGAMGAGGAPGYSAPEMGKERKGSRKADVYSMGVVMLEMLSGKGAAEEAAGLPQWAAAMVKEKEWRNEVFDEELMEDGGGGVGDELLNTLKLALHCVDPVASARPEVEQVLKQLEEMNHGSCCGGGGED